MDMFKSGLYKTQRVATGRKNSVHTVILCQVGVQVTEASESLTVLLFKEVLLE